MFTKLLIANRGEIACRIIATARRLGIATVAVFSDADAHARHVSLADEAWPIGPAPARDSYLVGARIVDVAQRSGAQAIHPGYGFLSENADFAEACAAAGIVFVGPPASAIRAMGSKSAAKALMERSGVPLVPGYHGAAQDLPLLAQEAGRIGYPVLIKASAGGGGKGMRVVDAPGGLHEAVEGAKREALAAFGDDRVLIERYLTHPRHIEIQVFADTHGQVVSLFERDCSIQRRHQKVVEEAPAPGMDGVRRAAMGEAACAAARAVGYVGAGTVEFIAQDGEFHFMEMNTRLQVEHPVTEMITGQDLVEWQLRVAAGEALPLGQDALSIAGHAIEVRVYAEDPARDFLPSIGTLAHLRQPTGTASVRVDTGVRQGDAITPYYDPMIAKLIVHGPDRPEAVRRLRAALAEYEVAGVQTNLGLLRAIAADAEFAAGTFDTGFLGRNPALSQPATEAANDTVIAAASLAWLNGVRAAAAAQDVWSPWTLADGWRVNGAGQYRLQFLHGDGIAKVDLTPLQGGLTALDFDGRRLVAEANKDGDGMALRLDGVLRRLRVIRIEAAFVVIDRGQTHVLRLVDPLAPPSLAVASDDRLSAPIPARVARVLVQPGDAVRKGDTLVVLEAMKMELTLSAPLDGTVATVPHAVGEMVEEGTVLVTFATKPG